jgi:hypothetical protein
MSKKSITEKRLENTVSDEEINIDTYIVLRKDRNSKGDGVCAYIFNDLAFSLRQHLNDISDEFLFFAD